MRRWFDLETVDLVLPRLAVEFTGYTIAQISDLHQGSGLTETRLADAVSTICAQKVDLIAITGDFLSVPPARYASTLTAQLSKLSAPDGVLAVLGNHDYDYHPGQVRAILEKAHIFELRNTAISIRRKQAVLHIAGIDSALAGEDRLEAALTQFPAGDGAAVLLSHEPDFADISSATDRFVLQLSGHSHGGQVLLPGIGSLFLPQMARKYPSGHYQVQNMQLYTNRGLGTTHLPFRLGCRPEITLFRLFPTPTEP